MNCRVCESAEVIEKYRAPNDRGFTSELKAIVARVRLGVCARCGHCQTLDAPPGGAADYYGSAYDLLTGSEEEDDLFNVRPDGTPIFRQELELENLKALVALPAKGRILDYGCGKGAFLRRFLKSQPEWIGHGFDMSERYRPFLEKIIPGDHFSVASLARLVETGARFDLIVMFQVVEHLERPREVLKTLRGLLAETGTLVITVPSLLAYSVDMFIADHLSHFTPAALDLLLIRCGFARTIFSAVHQAGQLMAAYRPDSDPALRNLDDVGRSYLTFIQARIEREIASWASFAERARDFTAGNQGTLIYGAGAAGTYLLNACEAQRDRFLGYIDRNPFKIGKSHLGLPIFAPEALPAQVGGIIAALSPGRAPRILEEAGLTGRGIPILYAT